MKFNILFVMIVFLLSLNAFAIKLKNNELLQNRITSAELIHNRLVIEEDGEDWTKSINKQFEPKGTVMLLLKFKFKKTTFSYRVFADHSDQTAVNFLSDCRKQALMVKFLPTYTHLNLKIMDVPDEDLIDDSASYGFIKLNSKKVKEFSCNASNG